MELSEYGTLVVYGGAGERRRTTRFPLNEDIKYRVLHKASRVSGSGRTLNVGSGGLLFTTEEKLQVGRQIEISMNWPARLGGTCPLKFVATGRVMRADAGKAAIRIERYEFRTRATSTETTAKPMALVV